jgi:predicted porin
VLDNSSAAGDVLPVEGQRVLATQFDATWEDDPVELYGHFGWVQDGDTNGNSSGSPRTSWLYYAAEGSYHFTPRLYGALRYSGAAAQRLVSAASSSRDVGSDGLVNRIQLGGGYWLTKTLLLKGEYVYQLYSGFSSTGSQVSGVNAWLDPSFHGVLAEVSFAY